MTATTAAATSVRMFRAEYRLTQQQLAALLSDPERPDEPVTRRMVQSWETGETNPPGCLWRALRDLRQGLDGNATLARIAALETALSLAVEILADEFEGIMSPNVLMGSEVLAACRAALDHEETP